MLIHDHSGGDLNSIYCLARLKLSDDFKREVLNRLVPVIGKQYTSVVIRHTDYQTDYKSFFNDIKARCASKTIFLCSDSIEVLTFARSFFDKSELIVPSTPPETHGLGLARYSFVCNDYQLSYDLMVNALCDLIGLALGSELLTSAITPGAFGVVFMGIQVSCFWQIIFA